jgi:hypothetical protein
MLKGGFETGLGGRHESSLVGDHSASWVLEDALGECARFV